MRSKKLYTLAAALGLIAFGLTGCGDDNGTNFSSDSSATSDNEALGMIIAEDMENFGYESELDESEVQVSQLEGKVDASGAPINSFYFLRIVHQEGKSIQINIEHPQGEPATAEVTITRDLGGIFRLFYDDPDGIYLPSVLDKPLEATSTRVAKFIRRGGENRHRQWRLIEISGLEMVSEPTTKAIQSVEINSASVSMTINDPLELMPLPDIPTFGVNEEVTLTVTTTDDTDYVFLHTPLRKFDFQPLGGGVFEGTWTTGSHPGRRRAAVDVIDEDTLFDDEAAYDSVLWGFNYRVSNLTVGTHGS